MATAFAAITETQYHFGWNSLAVLADAGHVFADVVGTAIALGAMQLATRPATGRRSFGFYRFEILAAVINALILIAIAGRPDARRQGCVDAPFSLRGRRSSFIR